MHEATASNPVTISNDAAARSTAKKSDEIAQLGSLGCNLAHQQYTTSARPKRVDNPLSRLQASTTQDRTSNRAVRDTVKCPSFPVSFEGTQGKTRTLHYFGDHVSVKVRFTTPSPQPIVTAQIEEMHNPPP
jgi:hypothetical protein